MDSRRRYRNLLVALVPLWAGCVQVPLKSPPVEQDLVRAPEDASQASTPDHSAAPGSRPLVDVKIVQAGVDDASRPDADGRSSAVPLPAAPSARPRIGDGQALTLEVAKSLAMRLNPVLGQSLAAVETAGGNEEIAYSGFLPSLQGDYSYQAFSSNVGFAGVRGRFPVLPVRGFGPGTQDFHVTELQLRWAIFQFGRQVAKHDQSVLRQEVARLQVDRARQSVEFDVNQAYFRALEARSSLVIAEKALTHAEAVLSDARNQERRGALTAEDVLRTEVQVAEVRQILTRARSAVRVTVAGLNRAIGLDVRAPTEVADLRTEPSVTQTLEDSLSQAMVSRREIAVVRKGIADADLDVKLARADYLPTLSIQSAVSDVTGTGVQNGRVLGGGAFAVLDVYTGGKRRGQVRAAQASVLRAAAQAKQVLDGIAYEVHFAHTAVDDAREGVAQARTTVAQARENYRLVDNRYKTGDAQPTDVIDAETSRTRAEQSLSTALYQYQTAVARLEFAVGAPIPTSTSAPEEPATPPPASTTPSPFARPETTTPTQRTKPSSIQIPRLPPLGGSDLVPRLTPPSPILPTTPGPPLGAAATQGTPELARPPYIVQPPGRLP
jgi:outer membrane protein TolC